tara:strand:- start:316 stop:900 length:585 start_codon:yes stop_codon:yes gene_type:complete
MKKLLFLLMFPVFCFGQDIPFQYFQNISTDSDVRYRLFATRNKYHFIKLDTRNGLMRQVQWNTESGYNFSSVINDKKFAKSVKEITELKIEDYKEDSAYWVKRKEEWHKRKSDSTLTEEDYATDEELDRWLKPKPLEESIKRALEIYEIERNGRFFLYPTTNIYNFILLDQIDGRTWQVQWNIDKDKRGTWVIY